MNQPHAKTLPLAEREQLNIGYMRLSDSAPLIIAQEKGFYHDYGLRVNLHREISWANIRDKVIAGALDAAQMLAPMPLVTTLGGAGIRAPIITGLTLSSNGNGITVTHALWEKMQRSSSLDFTSQGALASAQALKTISAENLPLTLATVHSYSTHTLLLQLWLNTAGMDLSTDVRIIVLPPEQMVDSLAQGVIDGFCAGEPWNTIASDYGIGSLAASGYQLWPDAPEKVLGVLEDWHTRYPTTHLRLRLALMNACQWLQEPANREEAILLLSQQSYLDLPAKYLRASLAASFPQPDNTPTHNQELAPQFEAGFPWRSQADYILQEFSPLLGKTLDKDKRVSLTQQCYRTDLFREAARFLDIASPDQDNKPQSIPTITKIN